MGARVGDRAMGTANKIAKKAKIVHIDIDPAEIGKNIETTIPLVGDIGMILREMKKYSLEVNEEERDAWIKLLKEHKTKHCSKNWYEPGETVKTDKPGETDKTGECDKTCETITADGDDWDDGDDRTFVNPKYLLSILHEYTGENAIITTEVGQNQIWAANNYKVTVPGSFITSGGLGTMGYGLPAAIGAKLGRPDANVIVISGDGSFQMSMQELGTIKQYGICLKIIIFNNSRLGMVREIQKTKYNGRYSQVFLDDNPDFIKIAEAYGFNGRRIRSNAEVRDALRQMMEDKGTFILECIVDPEESTL